MDTARERKVQKDSIDIIRKYKGYVYKNAQNMYTEKGRPDLTACIPAKLSKLVEIFGEDATVGLFVGLEIKRDCDHGYGTTEAQEVVGRKIKKANGIWLSVDDPLIVEALMIKFKGDDDVIQ